jgi:hypothetical protein
MSIITVKETIHDEPPLEQLLRKMTKRIDTLVKAEAEDSFQRGRYEEFTTSRLAGIINSSLRHDRISALGLTLDVHLEEFPKPKETVAGADLYISLVRRDTDEVVSKGLLVQSKRREMLLKTGEPERLGAQCKRMNRRSKKGAYVWIFEDGGVTSVKAPQTTAPLLQRVLEPSTVGELIARGLRCTAGDRKIGRSAEMDSRVGVSRVMDRLSVRRGLDFVVRRS